MPERRESLANLLRLKDRLTRFGIDPRGTDLERYLILRCALDSLSRLPDEPLAADVKRLLCKEYVRLAQPRSKDARELTPAPGAFVAVCKMATLRRFPAGQFDWEVSGIPRSWFLRLRGFDIVRLTSYVWLRLGGRGPIFFRHMGMRRPLMLTEAAADESYLRMADSLRLQPHVRGFVACSWLCSPDTHRASPHLSWLNRTPCDNGGVVVRVGPAAPRSGVLARSPERRQLYESGDFKPTLGLVAWDRRSMLAWAERHPRSNA